MSRAGADSGIMVLIATLCAWAAAALSGCERVPASSAADTPAASPAPKPPAEVVLYSSMDAEILGPLIERYEQEHGVKVRVLGDTEATKSTGLGTRLLAEHGRAKADVYWSSECLTSERLAKVGVLAEGWTPVAARARVIIANSEAVSETDMPRTLAELVSPKFKDRVGLAKPQFGTTRGHLGAIVATAGEKPARAWLERLAAARVRLYDGNASVARAVAGGEVWVGVVDIDDAIAAQDHDWPVRVPGQRRLEGGVPLIDGGTLLIPGSAGLVHGGPNPAGGRELLAYITSSAVEEALVTGPQRWSPTSPQGRARWPGRVPHGAIEVDWSKVEAESARALEIWESVGL